MNNRDIIELCAGNLLRRRTRTILAVVGVVVGTCAIVVMLSIGFGLSANYQEQIGSKTQTLMVYLQDFIGQYNSFLQGANTAISNANQVLTNIARGQ